MPSLGVGRDLVLFKEKEPKIKKLNLIRERERERVPR